MVTQDLDHFRALQTFVNISTSRNIPMIMEIPGNAKYDMQYVYNINDIVKLLSMGKGTHTITSLSTEEINIFIQHLEM